MAPPALPLSNSNTSSKEEESRTSSALLATRDEPEDEDEEAYNSEEDSDFDINAPAADEDDEEEDVGATGAGADEVVESDRPRKRRRIAADDVDGEADADVDVDVVMDAEFDSGDEATIQTGKEKIEKARKRKEKEMGNKGGKKRGGRGDDDVDEGDDFEIDEDDDVGGEGGFVRTRGMKMRMHEEQQRPLAKADGATVDVDALWEKMKAAGTAPYTPGKEGDGTASKDKEKFSSENPQPDTPSAAPQPIPGEETVTIKRVYKFAGEVITEEKVVPKDSAEAKLYLSSEEAKKRSKKDTTDDSEESGVKIQFRRPLRRFSRFDPNPPDMIKKNWEKNPVAAVGAQHAKGPKLNTVMKSKLDWAEYVDRTGIKDDLDVHSKAKEGYLGRMDFLNRVDAKREEERRNARLKNL
ncbi:hypothetical protein FQN50_000216 [Emmonsiellopsis sp. PD_5]|nr:hypothetical protein FQN50_000216 [Emmonsiellopsis sp. PD_5]